MAERLVGLLAPASKQKEQARRELFAKCYTGSISDQKSCAVTVVVVTIVTHLRSRGGSHVLFQSHITQSSRSRSRRLRWQRFCSTHRRKSSARPDNVLTS